MRREFRLPSGHLVAVSPNIAGWWRMTVWAADRLVGEESGQVPAPSHEALRERAECIVRTARERDRYRG